MLNVVDVAIIQNNRLLSVKREDPPCKGMYTLPGGGPEPGEEYYQTAIREVKEEINLDICCNEDDYLGSVDISMEDLVGTVHFYKGKVIGGKMKLLEGEISDVKWMTLEEFIEEHYKYDFKKSSILNIKNIVEKALGSDTSKIS